ncbi:hypothetical protein LCGC14_1125070 [marine sediment metagenome]|uniref:HNH nuclease domain-containing protein n=1 Tax=marine sediment metagenome TaxID=412755 RepID=A0A0F9MQQ4_9ZZZZ
MSKLERFFEKVEFASNGCWQWTASFYSNGYASFLVKSRSEVGKGQNRNGLAHRWAYRMFVGDIPEDLEIDHLCRNRGCVNPDHMEMVTHRENTLRGNSPSAIAARATHCPQGHVLDGWRRNGNTHHRYCMECNRMRSREAQKRKRLTGSSKA